MSMVLAASAGVWLRAKELQIITTYGQSGMGKTSLHTIYELRHTEIHLYIKSNAYIFTIYFVHFRITNQQHTYMYSNT